jgi:DNA-binding NarL/FixJ family response regulator
MESNRRLSMPVLSVTLTLIVSALGHAGKTTFAPAVAAKLASRVTSLQLTTRELEVLKLIAEGKANKEIGSQLHIAESTVKLHVNTLFEKLGVKSRTEAMRAGLERGLIRLR